jgi:RNA polymerase sigma factor (sigma-70 family)
LSERGERADQNGEAALLTRFLADARKFPVLSRSEEAALINQAAAGDKTAGDRLVASNLRYVVRVAVSSYKTAGYLHPGLSLMDLISEASIGLMRSVKKLNPASGFRVLTYARPGILHGIWRAVAEHARHECESLDDVVFESEGENETTFLDRLASEDESADVAALYEQVHGLVERLKSKERTAIEERYLHEKTLDEIGMILHVTVERVRQIERKALLRLRWAIEYNERLYAGARQTTACAEGK